MAQLVDSELPDDLYRRLSGEEVEHHSGKVIILASVDAGGWPHPMMLTYFEVAAKDRRNIRFAPYRDSASANNMRGNGLATMFIIDRGTVFYIKGRVSELASQMATMPHAAILNLHVEQVLVDQAHSEHETGACISGGVTYKDSNLTARRNRGRQVLKELLE